MQVARRLVLFASIFSIAISAPASSRQGVLPGTSLAMVRAGEAPTPEGLEAYVREQMRLTAVAAVSLAIIRDGRVVRVESYGVSNRENGRNARPDTLFQAASISKPLTAVAALQLVERGRLSLDTDVNSQLHGWQLTSADPAAPVPVTLRQLLSHTAGTSVSGLRGYAPGEPIPTLRQSLDGVPPANNAPVRVRSTPAAEWRYSGGGYLVAQLLLEQSTQRPFAELMRDHVLRRAGMRHSTFEQPLPAALRHRAAAGYYDDGSAVPGGSHTYPELAPAGLWTTPSDLAQFVIEVQRSLAGAPGALLRKATIDGALEVQAGTAGLGFEVRGEGPARRFSHGGRNEGFDSEMVGYAEGGDGAVVMLNGNDTAGMLSRILEYIGEAYGWVGYPRLWRSPGAGAVLPVSALAEAEGRYEFLANRMLTLSRRGNSLVARRGNGRGAYYDTLLPEAPDRFVGLDNAFRYTLRRDVGGRIVGMSRAPAQGGGAPRDFGRIGPLFDAVPPTAVQPAAATEQLVQTLGRLADAQVRGSSLEGLAPGLGQALGSASIGELAGIRSLVLRGRGDVRGRGIVRHGTDIATVDYYRARRGTEDLRLIIYFDAAGLLADYDFAAH